MPLSAPLGDGPRATAVAIPRFPSTLAAGIGIRVTGAAVGNLGGSFINACWIGVATGLKKECRPGDELNLIHRR